MENITRRIKKQGFLEVTLKGSPVVQQAGHRREFISFLQAVINIISHIKIVKFLGIKNKFSPKSPVFKILAG